jgi:hypothetical protein
LLSDSDCTQKFLKVIVTLFIGGLGPFMKRLRLRLRLRSLSSANNQTQNPSLLRRSSLRKRKRGTKPQKYTPPPPLSIPKWTSPSSYSLPLFPLHSASFLPPSRAATSTTATMSPFVAAFSLPPPPPYPPRRSLLPQFSGPKGNSLAYSR